MNYLEELNACGSAEQSFLPTVKLTDLQLDEKYKITKLKWVKTRFGDRIIVELCEECQVFLPPRFATRCEKLTQEQLNEIVAANISIIYRGHKQLGSCINKVSFLEFQQ